jgi:hypothetical protein
MEYTKKAAEAWSWAFTPHLMPWLNLVVLLRLLNACFLKLCWSNFRFWGSMLQAGR